MKVRGVSLGRVSSMGLTRDNWVTIILGVGLLVLTVASNIAVVAEWPKPYVQYGTGGAYIHPKLAISTVRLTSWGGSDAENVEIIVSFAGPVTDFSTDRILTPFEPSEISPDKKSIKGTIKRLASGETVNIYFTTEPSSREVDQKPVIREAKFKGGLGSPREPILRTWGLFLALCAVWSGLCFLFAYYSGQRQRIRALAYLTEAIQRGHSAAQEGVSEDRLRQRVEEWHRTLPFYSRPRNETLITCAQTAFAGARQGPTETAGQGSEKTDGVSRA
jgi:hypothetical protein